MLLLALLQVPNPPPGAPSGIVFVWYVVLVVLVIAAGLIFLLVKRKERVEGITERRASALDGLLKTRDVEAGELRKAREKALEDLSEVESELRVAQGIKMSELAAFWAEKVQIEIELEALRSQVRTLKGTLAKWESGELRQPDSGLNRRP